jgi:flagellar biosynthetic protein FlhB
MLQDRSQPATPHRRQKARQEGHVAKSQDLASAGLLIGAVAILFVFGASLFSFLEQLTRRQLGEPVALDADVPWALHECYGVGASLASVMLPVLGLVFVLALVVHVSQTGLLFLPRKVVIDFSRVSPVTGLKRLLSGTSFVRLLFGVGKLVAVGAVAAWSLWADRATILGLGELPLREMAASIAGVTVWTCLKIGLALGLLAVLDYIYQRYRHEQDLRMTPQEVREETRMMHGDPQILSRRRAVQRQLMVGRLAILLRQVDVVVTDADRLAIALRYDPQTMTAPVVVAKGADALAGQIRRLASENGVPMVERFTLANTLYREIELNAAVPTTLYEPVAEALQSGSESTNGRPKRRHS